MNGHEKILLTFCVAMTQKFAVPFFFALVTAIFLTSGEFAALTGNIHFWGVSASLFAAIFLLTSRKISSDISFEHADFFALFFFAWMIFTCLLQPSRFSLNMISVWIIGAAIWFLSRQILITRARIGAMILLLLALTFSEALLAIYQWKFVLPPLAQLGMQTLNSARESLQIQSEREWILLASRLRTADPTGTYVLSNTLGGQLATGLILLFGMAGMICKRGAIYQNIIFVATSLIIFAALILTHCRSAVLAFAFVALIMICNLIPQRKVRFAFGAAIFLAAIFFVSTSEAARKSLLFRAEYWQSTMTMIADSPIFGCGGGNFKIVYPQYKLPQASEEIADPHNFVLELCATGGAPALILFVLLIFCASKCCNLTKFRHSPTFRHSREGGNPELPLQANFRWRYIFIVISAVISVLVSYTTHIAIIPTILVMIFITLPIFAHVENKIDFNFITHEKLIWSLIFTVAVLLIHLLAAGGIAYTNTHLWLWILLPMMINLSQACSLDFRLRGNDKINRKHFLPQIKTILSIFFFSAAIWIYFANYLPVTQAFIFQSEAEVATDLVSQKECLCRAHRADPRNHEIAFRYLICSFNLWKAISEIPENPKISSSRESSSQLLAELEEAVQYATSLLPPSAKLYHVAGNMLSEIALACNENDARRDELRERAVELLSRAVTLYPHEISIRISFAIALHRAGDENAARRECEHAFTLDAQTPHVDKKLNRAEIEALNQIIENSPKKSQKNSP